MFSMSCPFLPQASRLENDVPQFTLTSYIVTIRQLYSTGKTKYNMVNYYILKLMLTQRY